MPDMPEPPMPTKWMRLTLCRTGELLAGIGARARGVAPSQRARLARHLEQALALQSGQHLGERGGSRLELLHRDAGAAVGEERGIGGLLVGHEPGQRKEDRRYPRSADLRHGDGPRTA